MVRFVTYPLVFQSSGHSRIFRKSLSDRWQQVLEALFAMTEDRFWGSGRRQCDFRQDIMWKVFQCNTPHISLQHSLLVKAYYFHNAPFAEKTNVIPFETLMVVCM